MTREPCEHMSVHKERPDMNRRIILWEEEEEEEEDGNDTPTPDISRSVAFLRCFPESLKRRVLYASST